jgi:hypothetical protein
MKLIKLTKGKFAIVDDDDFEYLIQFKWQCHNRSNTCYAARSVTVGVKKRITQKMHQLILGENDLKNGIDHRNGDGLDNRKLNLRFCNQSENNMNKKPRVGCTSKYKGVYLKRSLNKFVSTIKINGRAKHLGFFDNDFDAAIAYDNAAKELFGEFAKINFE